MTTPRLAPVTLREANAFIHDHHRHHKPARGCRFVIGLAVAEKIVGVAVVSRPVSRAYDWRRVAEVTRLATDGTSNACSMLYAACARAAAALGYDAIQTYILASESGVSLRAAGWTERDRVVGRQWDHSSERQLRLDGGTRRTDQPTEDKVRWSKGLR